MIRGAWRESPRRSNAYILREPPPVLATAVNSWRLREAGASRYKPARLTVREVPSVSESAHVTQTAREKCNHVRRSSTQPRFVPPSIGLTDVYCPAEEVSDCEAAVPADPIPPRCRIGA